jgi:hypothetical protein
MHLQLLSKLGGHAQDNWRDLLMGEKVGFTASMFEIDHGQHKEKTRLKSKTFERKWHISFRLLKRVSFSA